LNKDELKRFENSEFLNFIKKIKEGQLKLDGNAIVGKDTDKLTDNIDGKQKMEDILKNFSDLQEKEKMIDET